jgi:hypothetical protein
LSLPIPSPKLTLVGPAVATVAVYLMAEVTAVEASAVAASEEVIMVVPSATEVTPADMCPVPW